MSEPKLCKEERPVFHCEECNKIIKCKPSQARRFCSRSCWKIFYQKLRTFICTYCSKAFETKPEEKKPRGRPFCNVQCYSKFQIGSNNPSFKDSARIINCLQYQVDFKIETVKRRKNAAFCSFKCKASYHNINGWPNSILIDGACTYCHKIIKINPNTYKNRRPFCSRECADKGHSSYISGKNNGRYVHGEGIRAYPPGWSKTHKDHIRKRDNHTCQLC
jgi:hypothetical protein